MNRKFFNYLVDPISQNKFSSLVIFKAEKREILDGIVYFSSNWYPVISGIPRILIGEAKAELLQRYIEFFNKYNRLLSTPIAREWQAALKSSSDTGRFSRHQRNTADSFTFEWKNIYRENSYEKKNYLHFTGPYLRPGMINHKTVIDVGCGSGRFTKQPALMGARVVFGVDLGDTVEIAYQLTRNLTNVAIVQCDIYHMPFKSIFDLAHSIGVIHHLPDPNLGFSRLPLLLKKGGQLIIWVYNRRNNNRALYLYEPLRTVTRHIPKNILFYLCYFPAGMVHVINLLTMNMDNPPFGYYRNFPFNMKLNDAFDVLATPKCNYYLVEDIVSWYKQTGLLHIKAYEHPEAGITCIGTNGK